MSFHPDGNSQLITLSIDFLQPLLRVIIDLLGITFIIHATVAGSRSVQRLYRITSHVRDILKVPLVCNTTTLTQRGLRCNLCDIVKEKTEDEIVYLSAHHLGIGGDLSSPEMTAEEMRQKIEEKQDLLPYPVRIELKVNWLHIDCYDDIDNDNKITYFNP